jgi:uncharacterized integral membrane protein (TIGR00697 family)
VHSTTLAPHARPEPDLRLLVAVGAYVAAALIANVMSVRLVRVVGFSIDAGTLTYPLTFTLRDVIHKLGGRRAARATIVATAGFNVFLAVGLWAAARLPADLEVGPQREFGEVLVGTWRIVVASIVAQVIAELLDTEVYHRVVLRFGHSRQWLRVLASNAVSVPVDSVVFVLIAFGGEVPASVAWSIIVANIVVKGITSVVSTPLIYAVREEVPVDVASGLREPARVGAARHDVAVVGDPPVDHGGHPGDRRHEQERSEG